MFTLLLSWLFGCEGSTVKNLSSFVSSDFYFGGFGRTFGSFSSSSDSFKSTFHLPPILSAPSHGLPQQTESSTSADLPHLGHLMSTEQTEEAHEMCWKHLKVLFSCSWTWFQQGELLLLWVWKQETVYMLEINMMINGGLYRVCACVCVMFEVWAVVFSY